MPTLCLLQKKALDGSTYVIDGNTGAHVMHYTGHFGSVKALKTLVEEFGIDPSSQIDFYKLNTAHYAARSGNVNVLVYLNECA